MKKKRKDSSQKNKEEPEIASEGETEKLWPWEIKNCDFVAFVEWAQCSFQHCDHVTGPTCKVIRRGDEFHCHCHQSSELLLKIKVFFC